MARETSHFQPHSRRWDTPRTLRAMLGYALVLEPCEKLPRETRCHPEPRTHLRNRKKRVVRGREVDHEILRRKLSLASRNDRNQCQLKKEAGFMPKSDTRPKNERHSRKKTHTQHATRPKNADPHCHPDMHGWIVLNEWAEWNERNEWSERHVWAGWNERIMYWSEMV